jgi:hypothetical protein
MARGSDPLQGVEGSAHTMYIGIGTFYAALVAPLGNPLSSRFIAAIEFHLI